MKFKKLPIVAVTSALMAAPTFGIADDHDELELDEAYLYFELNDTDGDLGIHGKADGDAWKQMKIEAPNERTLLNITWERLITVFLLMLDVESVLRD